MSDDRSIHDLLDRAVQGVIPTAVDPEHIVVARAGRERRRSVLLTAVASLVVMLGGASVLSVVDTQTRGDGPAARPGEQSAGWTAGQPDDALGREEAAARAAEQAAAEAAAAAEANDGLVVSVMSAPLAVTPAGWTEFPASNADAELDLSNLDCPATGNVVYRATISLPDVGGTQRPCNGRVTTPYIWDTSDQMPRLDEPVTQVVLPEGTPRWVQNSTSSAGEATTDVYFPTTGQFVRAVGVPFDDLLKYLQPAGAPIDSPLIPEDTTGVNARISVRGENLTDVPPDDLADLLGQLQQLPQIPHSGQTCFGSQPGAEVDWQYVIQLRSALTPVGTVVIDVPAFGCAAAVSTFGGMARVDPNLLTTLQHIAGS